MKRSVLLTVNGERHEVFIEPNLTLLELLREDLNLKGAKEACGIGACGACTVLMDGKPVNACIVLALEAEGKEIETIEGLVKGNDLHPLQRSFIDHYSFQCGFCRVRKYRGWHIERCQGNINKREVAGDE